VREVELKIKEALLPGMLIIILHLHYHTN